MIRTTIPIKYGGRDRTKMGRIQVEIIEYRRNVKSKTISLIVQDSLYSEIEVETIDDEGNPSILTADSLRAVETNSRNKTYQEVEEIKQLIESLYDIDVEGTAREDAYLHIGLYLDTIFDPEPIYECPAENWQPLFPWQMKPGALESLMQMKHDYDAKKSSI